MSFSKEAIMVEKKGKEERIFCPVGTFFTDLEKTFGRKSQFYNHMTRSRIEFLKGVKLSSHCWMTGSNALRKGVLKRPEPN
jgi:hypothetical protein